MKAAHPLRCICDLLVETHVQVQVIIISIMNIRNDDEGEVKLTTKNVMQMAKRWKGCGMILG